MKKQAWPLIQLAILVIGVILAAYVGIWLGFIGGIVTFLDAVKVTPVSSMGVALGLAKFVFGPMLGSIIVAITMAVLRL